MSRDVHNVNVMMYIMYWMYTLHPTNHAQVFRWGG